VFAFPRIHPGEFVELGDFSGNVDWKGRGIESRDAFHARLAGQKGEAKGFFAYAIRADDAQSGDDDPRNHAFSERSPTA
jgi:hypothetical protein